MTDTDTLPENLCGGRMAVGNVVSELMKGGGLARRRYQNPRPKKVNGKWQIRIWEDVVMPDGTVRRRHPRINLGSVAELPTEKLARRAAEPVLARLNAAAGRPTVAIRFSAFCEKWKLAILPEMKPSTRISMRSNIGKWLVPEFGEWFLHEISPERVQVFVAKLRGRCSEKSIWNIVMTLRSIWKTALDWGYTRERIFDGVRVKLAPPEKQARCFTAEEVQRILAAADEPYRTLYWLAAETGMRAGELCGLRWQDVDFEARTVRVQQSAWRGIVSAPKSRRGVRTLAASGWLIERLKEMKAHDPKPCELVFHSRNGTPWDANLIQKRRLRPLLERLQIECAGFHAFRHFAATQMNRIGAPSAMMRERLGHSSLAVTDRYTHSIGSDDLLVAQRMAESVVPFRTSNAV